jgi:hypothetical protein
VAVSDLTAEMIYKVVRKHVSDQQMRVILKDLLGVPGNKSFRDTIGKLWDLDAVYRSERSSSFVQEEKK